MTELRNPLRSFKGMGNFDGEKRGAYAAAHSSKPQTYPKGRRCTYRLAGDERCITILNMYNHGPYCLHHAAVVEARIHRPLGKRDDIMQLAKSNVGVV